MIRSSYFISTFALIAFFSMPTQAITLEQVYNQERLICGITTGETGFSAPDSKNQWHGLEIDLCRLVTLAIFGSDGEDYYQLVPLTQKERLLAVSAGKVHLLAAKTAWSWLHSIDYSVAMVGPYFRDGQGFLLRNSSNIRSAWNLQNVTICVVAGSPEERRVRRFLKRLKYHTSLSLFDNLDDIVLKFENGDCGAITADITELSEARLKLRNPIATRILPQLLTQKPIGMIVPFADAEWPQLVQLIFSALTQAEELGLTSKNIIRAQEEGNQDQKDFIKFGEDSRFEVFSSDNWILEVIAKYGNYGEMFKRHFGAETKTPFPRGVNRLWFTGGLVAETPLFYTLPESR